MYHYVIVIFNTASTPRMFFKKFIYVAIILVIDKICHHLFF
nr:MAG TPA_asm: hypothetical protein [Bacteriophage sp.]